MYGFPCQREAAEDLSTAVSQDWRDFVLNKIGFRLYGRIAATQYPEYKISKR